jgi:hypothetical protein
MKTEKTVRKDKTRNRGVLPVIFYLLSAMFLIFYPTGCEQPGGTLDRSLNQPDSEPDNGQDNEWDFDYPEWVDGDGPPPEIIGIEVAAMPDTTYYALNEPFSTAGLALNVLFDNGAASPYTGQYTVVKTPRTDLGGAQLPFNVRVTIEGKSYELDPEPMVAVSHDTKKLVGITVTRQPSKQAYYLGERFNLAGIQVTATFQDTANGNAESTGPLSVPEGSVSGYDRFKRGTQTVTVKVNGISRALDPVTVSVPLLSGEATVNFHHSASSAPKNFAKPSYIKGQEFDFERSNIKVTVPLGGGVWFALTPENGGVLASEVSGYNKDAPGLQTMHIKLENNPDMDVSFPVYVLDAEPDVWFDFGYMRHEGDPAGKGPGDGKYRVKPGEKLALAPIRYLIGYEDDPAVRWANTVGNRDAGAVYSWEAWQIEGGGSDWTLKPSAANTGNDDRNDDWAGAVCAFTPKTAGTYRVRVTVTGKSYVTGVSVTKSAEADVVCSASLLSSAAGPFKGPLRNFSCGQFTNGGSGYGWSLCSVGGYMVWDAKKHQDSYLIAGNAFPGWSEPGIVWFQEDRNGNGLPDETWYEVKGSDDDTPKYRPQLRRRYAIRYILLDEPEDGSNTVAWLDSLGRSSVVKGWGWPKEWGVQGDQVTFTGTMLRDTGVFDDGSYGGDMFNLGGYVDVATDIGKWKGDSGVSMYETKIRVSDAVHADGTPANLNAVRFIKVQTGYFRYGGPVGGISTEIHHADGLGTLTSFPMPM